MKYGFKEYWKPTPKNIRKVADSILASAMLISTFAVFSNYQNFAVAIMIAAGVAKFFSNFFSIEERPVQ